jgi:hypothetical protein
MMIKRKNEKQNKGRLSTRKGRTLRGYMLPLAATIVDRNNTQRHPQLRRAMLLPSSWKKRGINIGLCRMSKQEEKMWGQG